MQICLNYSKIYDAISVTRFEISSGRKNSKTKRIIPLFIIEPRYQINLIGYRENVNNRLLSSICKINKMNLITGKSVEKGMIFYRQPSKMQINFNRQNFTVFQELSNVTFSADLSGRLASEESLNGKN